MADYAFTVARKLRTVYSRDTIFATPESSAASVGETASFSRETTAAFEVVPLQALDWPNKDFQHVILHYVNYGYQKRGVPFDLPSTLRKLREQSSFRLLTIFHELYASGPPWRSAFWLRPFQKWIAKSISQLSDASIMSSETMCKQLKQLSPNANIGVQPVFSNFGEPKLARGQLANRSPHRWVICGGTVLIERSLRSFRAAVRRIPEHFSPHELFVLGGKDDHSIRSQLSDLPNIRTVYRPEIAATEASQILSSCSFAWLDYFHRPNVPTDAVPKSGAFAAACAHGVIPVFPHRGSEIALKSDRLPGPYFVEADRFELPSDHTQVASEIFGWYTRNANSDHLVRGVAKLLGFEAGNGKVC